LAANGHAGHDEGAEMRKVFEIGGLVAAAVLIAFGIGAVVLGVNGRTTVRDSLQAEQIVGSDDMSPAAIAVAAKEAGLPASTPFPTVDVAGKPIDTGERARAFAGYMRIHALESSGGLTYAQMGRFATADGKPAGTNDETLALKGPDGQPVSNAARNTWITETALGTALNVSYMAEKTALFGIVVGIALLLSGFGFAILAIGGALRNPERAFGLSFGARKPKTPGVPVA
jgi:F0F1-type ATP synthase membrane subunit c/vacuolar-type H+-ATPase subunit K